MKPIINKSTIFFVALFIVASYCGEWQDIYENKSGSISCGGRRIHVLSAQYGRTDNLCKGDVTAIIRPIFEGKNSAQVTARNDLLGDPCPGNHKILAIEYECN